MKCLSRKEQAKRDGLLIEDYSFHKDLVAISKKYGIHINTAFKILKRNGIKYIKREHPNKIKEDLRNDILAKYKETRNASFVAKEFNVCVDVVLKIGRKFGIEPHENGVLSRKYKCNYKFFSDINTEEKAYWVGFICADGNLFKNRLSIAIHKQDTCLLERFKIAIEAENPVKIYEIVSRGKKGWIASIVIISKEIIADLKKIGIEPRKTGKLKASEILSFIPDSLTRHFYRGFIDGDGCFTSRTDGRPVFSVGEKGGHLIKKLKDFLTENGVESQSILTKRKDKNDFYSLKYTAIGDLEKIHYILYNDSTIFLQRKKDRLEKGLLLYSKSFKS